MNITPPTAAKATTKTAATHTEAMISSGAVLSLLLVSEAVSELPAVLIDEPPVEEKPEPVEENPVTEPLVLPELLQLLDVEVQDPVMLPVLVPVTTLDDDDDVTGNEELVLVDVAIELLDEVLLLVDHPVDVVTDAVEDNDDNDDDDEDDVNPELPLVEVAPDDVEVLTLDDQPVET